ncbi:membrane protein insertase YidC [Oricola cellulosilytica]|uniref:Membrane protein insertase YidC n=1 Tax=Oricola cellulosilytica TaxID=1429082 RepID=A0A4R0PM89_9HYPH|nr:membrane protein insertase YidC [Oricola cellulosilytica]TCD16479.1 membrane protein insertase YidC [Oricola cellulosilytica]
MENSRNLLITIILSVIILAAWQYLYIGPKIEAERQAQLETQKEQQVDTDRPASTSADQAPGEALPQATIDGTFTDAPSGPGVSTSTEVDVDAGRIIIDTPTLVGSINLKGARFDTLQLKDYKETLKKNSNIVTLLAPSGQANGYFGEFGYTGFEGAPGPDTVWRVEGDATLTPTTPVELTYEASNGIVFKRTISVDDQYMFDVEDVVTNGSAGAIGIQGYGRVTRFSRPEKQPIFVLHEGLIGVTGEEGLEELTFNEIEDDGQVIPGKSTDGWLGITDKYWATALIPQQGSSFQPRYSYFAEGRTRYQADFLTDPVMINGGQSVEFTHMFFAGAKKTSIVDNYEAERGIRQFELMIDWGWFHFITKPLFYLLDWLYNLFGNFGVAILITTVIVKAVFFPLANMSYASMARMKVMQPKMQEIKERYGDDREKMQRAMMDLYKTEKINPVAGCWPMLIQIPVFFALYKVLYVTIEMRHAPFFGWIQDLSAPDPTSIFNLFGLLPYDPSAVPVLGSFLMLGVWPLLMGITMFLQMRMNPTPPDPTQAMIFTWMPVVFTFMLATFPAGLVIYWAWNNTLSIIQQGVIMKRNGAKIELWNNLQGLFRRKNKAGAAE